MTGHHEQMTLRAALAAVSPTTAEVALARPGDDLVPEPDAVMDRAFTLPAAPETVWPWIVQLGKQRAGWYVPRSVERVIPPSRRALRHIDARWQALAVGDVIPDWGGADATFEVALLESPHALVHRSTRGRVQLSWAIVLSPLLLGPIERTRVHLRLRIGPVKRQWLAAGPSDLVDLVTVAGLAAGLSERLEERH